MTQSHLYLFTVSTSGSLRWSDEMGCNLPQDESSDVPSSILYYFPEYLTACHGNDLALV